jgi:hypothetical protein
MAFHNFFRIQNDWLVKVNATADTGSNIAFGDTRL